MFNEARERASKALGFQKKLRNDLETAASYHVEVSAFELLAQLEKAGHMQVHVCSVKVILTEKIIFGVQSNK